MWLVPDEDKQFFLEFFGKRAMPWSQSNPAIMRIAAWKKASNDGKEKQVAPKDNGKNKEQ